MNDDLSGEGYATYNSYDNSIRIHIYEQDYDDYAEGYEIEEADIWCEYNSDGILEHYRFDYDQETIITLDLLNAFWIQNWLYVVLGIIALVAIVVIVVYFSVIYQKKPKEVAPSAPAPAVAPTPVEETPELEKIEEKPGKGVFCPYCGSSNTAGSNFCEDCGKNLEE